jgi:hypothetical protein
MASLQRIFESETPDQHKKQLKYDQAAYRKRQKTKYGADINSINIQDSIIKLF